MANQEACHIFSVFIGAIIILFCHVHQGGHTFLLLGTFCLLLWMTLPPEKGFTLCGKRGQVIYLTSLECPRGREIIFIDR